MDRRFGSDDMESERHQDRIDEDRETNGFPCPNGCGFVGTEDEASDPAAHHCPSDPYCAKHGMRFDPDEGCPECMDEEYNDRLVAIDREIHGPMPGELSGE